MPHLTRVKVCCIASVEEARLAVGYGAAALGLVSRMPSGPGVISQERIAEIAASAPPGVATFLLTCEQETETIVAQQRNTGVNTIQLCDRMKHGDHAKLRAAVPGIKIVQVIHVAGEESVEEAVAAAPHVSALLLDSGNPALAVKELGGTGRTHDWAMSARIVKAVKTPVLLAGGLNPQNVAAGIRQVRPFGVDVCSGLRTDGRLDETKLSAFMSAVAMAAG